MIPVGEKPILWHLMHYYSQYGCGKTGCFLAVRPSFSLHLVDMNASGGVSRMVSSQDADLWINGGFFIFRYEIFDYMRDGEELVEAPFRRLIEADQLLAIRHERFWRPMDTLKDKQVLEDLVEQGEAPWITGRGGSASAASRRMRARCAP